MAEQTVELYTGSATGKQIDNAAAKVAAMEETLSGTAGTIPSSAAVKNYVDGKSVDISSKEDITNKKTTITGNELSSTYYPTIKAVADYIHQQTAQWGIVSQTQTWTQASDGGYDYTMSDLQYGWIPQANIDLFENAGATFNTTTGYFELNGLTDISYNEMMSIFYRSSNINMQSLYKNYTNLRTVLKNNGYYIPPFDNMFEVCTNLEVLVKDTYPFYPNYSNYYMFYNCSKLKSIGNNIYNSTNLIGTFKGCSSLESVAIQQLKGNLSISDSPRLTIGSIIYMINNAANTNNITITLHATAYARAIADADVQAALEAHPTITLASV